MEQKVMAQKAWWKELHWPEYGAELVGTAFLIIVGLSAVVFDFGQGLPMSHLIPSMSLRLLIMGLIFAGSGSLVAISPFGRLSGAHINPSVSLAFLVQGKMQVHDFFGYVIGQIAGAILGEVILVLAWGSYAASVHNGMPLPGAGYPLWLVFLAETVLTFLLVFLIFVFVSSHRMMHWTPLMNWLLVATMVWQEAPISGTSLNPARSFAPALLTGLWLDQWIYWLAPPLGALFAVGAFRLLSAGERDVLTGKLFHVPHYRSVFKNVAAPHLPANGKLKKAPESR
jgi:aquaporin Z